LTTAFCPSPLNTPSHTPATGFTNSTMTPTSRLGASVSTTVERSAVSITVMDVMYSRLNGVLNCPAFTAHGASDQRMYASRSATVAAVRAVPPDSYSTSTRYEKCCGNVPSPDSRARFSDALSPVGRTTVSRTWT
jgi:hypothetical protein